MAGRALSWLLLLLATLEAAAEQAEVPAGQRFLAKPGATPARPSPPGPRFDRTTTTLTTTVPPTTLTTTTTVTSTTTTSTTTEFWAGMIYTGGNYKKAWAALGVGYYDTQQLNDMGIPKDAISSVKVQPGYQVILYALPGWAGRSVTLTRDVQWLSSVNFDDFTWSLVVLPLGATPTTTSTTAWAVKLSTGTHWQSDTSTLFAAGKYDTDQMGVGKNAISSVRVHPGYQVTLFARPGFRGKRVTITSDIEDLALLNFDDRTRSVIVEEDGSTPRTATTTTTAVPLTSAVPETTTPAPGTTTAAPQTTMAAPKTTAAALQTTTAAPETTTPAPGTTTAAPETTTAVPETTTAAPETTTMPAPETTTATPETTTAAPETTITAAAPETTVAAPETTLQPVVKTTAAPETTAEVPQSTAATPKTTLQPVAEDCLCVFDVDRTLTSKQGWGSRCPGAQQVDGIWDYALGGGVFTLSELGRQGLGGTFCDSCYLGAVTAGNASNEGDYLLGWVLRSRAYDALVGDPSAAYGWSSSQDSVSSPFVLRRGGHTKVFAVKAIVDFYQSRYPGQVNIPKHRVHFFDDRAENVAFFAGSGYNAQQVSCASRDFAIYNRTGRVGLCGARVDEVINYVGVETCKDRAARLGTPAPSPAR